MRPMDRGSDPDPASSDMTRRPTALAIALVLAAGAAIGLGAGQVVDALDGPAPQLPADASTAGDAAPTANALGAGANEAVLVPITPCRIIDTRQGGGKLEVGSPRTFVVRGVLGPFAAQGGQANGCGIPAAATGIEVTITAVDAGSGFLRAWPAGATPPNATFMNYDDAFNVSNTGTLKLCTLLCLADQDLTLRAYGTATHVVADVSAYTIATAAAEVTAAGALVDGNRVTRVDRLGLGTYQVIFDQDVTDCVYQGTVDRSAGTGWVTLDARVGNANGVYVETRNAAGDAVDQPFMVEVIC